MIYLDANFFVFCNIDEAEKGENARRLVQKIIDGTQDAATSALALDEVMWVILKTGMKKDLRRIIEGIYSIPNLKIIEVSPDIPLISLDLIEKYGLKPRDAFHAAIMKSLGIRHIASDDADFDRVEWIKRIRMDA